MHESHLTGVGDLVGVLVGAGEDLGALVGARVGACIVQSDARATCMYITTATHARQNMKAANQQNNNEHSATYLAIKIKALGTRMCMHTL